MMSTRNLIAAMFAVGLVVTIGGIARADAIAYWDFDEVGGAIAADTSGSAAVHNGTLRAGSEPTRVDGRFGGALDFKAINTTAGDLVDVAHHADLNLNGSSTISMWYYHDEADHSGSNWPGMISKGSAGGNGWGSWRSRTGNGVVLKRWGHQPSIGNAAISDGWVHFLARYDASNPTNLTVYRNGVRNDIVVHTDFGKDVTNTNPLIFGTHDQTDTARLDDTVFFNNAISDAHGRSIPCRAISARTTTSATCGNCGTASPPRRRSI